MRFIDSAKLTRTFSRSYYEEAALALSAIDCVLNGEKAIYASSELTTGRRVQAVLREIGAPSSNRLRERLGASDYNARVWTPNIESATTFARHLREVAGGGPPVLTPAPFSAPDWNQQEYLAFWEELIRTRAAGIAFNAGWEFSSGCTFEYLVAGSAGLPTWDANLMPLPASDAIALVRHAIATLRTDGLDVDALVENLKRMDSGSSARAS